MDFLNVTHVFVCIFQQWSKKEYMTLFVDKIYFQRTASLLEMLTFPRGTRTCGETVAVLHWEYGHCQFQQL